MIRKAHNILCDLDTALVLKDIDYLTKLSRYTPKVKSRVVTTITTCAVNSVQLRENK